MLDLVARVPFRHLMRLHMPLFVLSVAIAARVSLRGACGGIRVHVTRVHVSSVFTSSPVQQVRFVPLQPRFIAAKSTVRAVFSTAAYWAEMSAAAPTSRRLFRRSAPPMGQMFTFIAVVVTVTVRKEGSSPPRRQQASSQLQESEQECASLRAQVSGASTRICFVSSCSC